MLDAVQSAAAAKGVRCLRIDGATPASERQALVHTFQGLPAGTPCLFALSILAAGQGLTLTAAHDVVFAELHWVPAVLMQAEDRVHRIGQKAGGVCVRYVCLKNSLDDFMWRTLERKLRTIAAAVDGRECWRDCPSPDHA